MPNLLTTEQVADRLQLHWQTVLLYIKRGDLKAVKLGRGYRIREEDLERFLASRERAQAAS